MRAKDGLRATLLAVLALPWCAPAGAAPGDPPPPFPSFTDVAIPSGLAAFRHDCGDGHMDNIVEATGVGPCIFDYDGDGDLDVYLPNGRWTQGVSDNRGRDRQGKLRNALFRNEGNGTFRDVTLEAGVAGSRAALSASAADYDGDGDLDLYVSCYGPNELFRNDGNGRFTDATAAAGVGDPGFGVNALWLDHDGDGDLDLYVCNYLQYDDGKFRAYYAAVNFPGPLSYNGQPDRLYRNEGDGTFKDATREAGLLFENGRGMSATAADLDGDGRLDIYVSNDAMENNAFFAAGKGVFADRALESGLAFGQCGQGVASMGPSFGDVNRDGRLDLLVPDMDYMSLLVWRKGVWEDDVYRSGIGQMCGQYTGWGGVLADFDNDGHLDLFIANGHPHHEYPENAVIARNDGAGRFADMARVAGGFFGGSKWYSRGAAAADMDDDGDVDLLVMDLNGHPHLLRNDGGNRNRWLRVDVRAGEGRGPAIGARVTVVAEGRTMIDDVQPVRGYLSQGDARPHFGLGRAAKADRVEVRWPDGGTRTWTDVEADRTLTALPGPR